ncbi:MAG TPA: tetratricopeptide repeat protein [Armatimonadota bacterium]|jgi:tetratricopeptide (TPR) repeat protein
MARSIHATRRQLEEQHRWDYADERAHAAALERLDEGSTRKRRIKRAIAADRAAPARDGRSDALSIPVTAEDAGPNVHYPASPDDIGAVMRRLPVGALDGLRSVDLCLGASWQGAASEDDEDGGGGGDADPYTGRKGWETFPGVYSPGILGVYTPDTARIRVFGMVYRPDLPDREMWEACIRIRMLSTFVHEAAHHFDHAARIARGRWLANEEEKVELYAEDREFAWLSDCVVPFMEEAYAEPLGALLAWVERHGGTRLNVAQIAGDPRRRAKGGRVLLSALFTTGGALEQLATDVYDEEDARTTRLGFARNLHYADLYDEALESIGRVLADHPNDAEALALMADIYVHQDRNDEAANLARKVLEASPDNRDAWKALADALEALEQWPEMLEATDRALDLDSGRDWFDVGQRARALLALNRFEELEPELAWLSGQSIEFSQREAAELREAMEAKMVEARDADANS